jgi:hypothetical protein
MLTFVNICKQATYIRRGLGTRYSGGTETQVAEVILSLRYAELQTSSFGTGTRGSLSGTVVPIPAPWESQIVLRSLWPKFPAEAIRVHALQYVGDAALVPIYELDDAIAGGRL